MTGVLLLALGNPYYGNYAVQLARSIKSVDSSISVSVAYSGSVLSHNVNLPFDNLIEVPKDYFYTDGLPDFIKAKTYLYELSPYKHTIFIDADVIWLPQKSITELFNEFKEIDITFSNRGKQEVSEAKAGFIHWADPKEITRVYGNDGWLYNLASEFIYFRKNKKVERFFKIAQEIYSDPKIEYKKFAHHLPDELAFEIAMIKTGMYPHAENFIPFYWEQFERKSMPVHEMYSKYYGYSMGGNVNTPSQEQIYNNLANNYNSQFKVSGYFPAKSKNAWLSERTSL